MSAPAAAALRADLLAWGRDNLRDLPWRRTRDPWAVLVSETMLQQTQVARVIARYESFMSLFPTPDACAESPIGDVLRSWEGLGYNRRGVFLHRAATLIVERHGGSVPATLDALLALPGVGAYTARAVLVFAFEQEHGVVDTNVGRVLARAVAGRRLEGAESQVLADSLVVDGEGWLWNQSVMELGALVCSKRSPRCDRCPLTASCAWRSGDSHVDPAEGSAATSTTQSRFEGSDRQGRGRLIAALRVGTVTRETLPSACGWPDDPDRAARIARDLIAEGMAAVSERGLVLP